MSGGTGASSGEWAQGLLGRVVAGKMELKAFIGAGAMGCVFRAHHHALSKDIALKVMKVQGLEPNRVERFVREAQTAARIEHPNAVQVYDSGVDGEDRLLYIAMELLRGQDLHVAIQREGPLAESRVCEIMAQVLGAVAIAHDLGVIHRDLKPANIMLVTKPDDDGELVEHAKVCDFGLAKLLKLETSLSLEGAPATMQGMIAGTPQYMSPEQAVGEALDARSDVYSCGVIMYEALTGRLPFNAETLMGVLMKQVSEQPRRLSELVPDIDARLEETVLWAMEKDRNRRPSARELRKRLRELLGATTRQVELRPALARIELSRVPAPRPVEPLMAAPASSTGAVPLPFNAIVGETHDLGLPIPLSASALTPLPPELIEVAPPLRPSGDELARIDDLVAEAAAEIAIRRSLLPEPAQAGVSVDHRKHAAVLSDRAQYMWKNYGITFEPHRGQHPFWICDHRNEILGPLGYEDAMKVLAQEGAAGNGDRVTISTGAGAAMGAPTFVRLVGQESLLERHAEALDFSRRPFSGSLERTSLATLFGRVARERATGRLIFHRTQRNETERVEIHLVGGKPTFVYASEVALQLPPLMVSQGLVTQDMLPRLLHEVLDREVPLEDVVARETGAQVASYRAAFMRERLLYLFGWKKSGSFALDPDALPTSTTPFASSLLTVLPDLVYRSFGVEELRRAIAPLKGHALPRSERFASTITEMNLTLSQREVVKSFGKPRTLAQSVDRPPAEEKLYLTMAYILLETDLLLKPL